jgi:hypothetical protein
MILSEITNYLTIELILYHVGQKAALLVSDILVLLVSIPQLQLPAEVESVLLQQVLNLTPEQLSSLPPEQQQQVIQLQQVLRRDQIQPS